MQAALPTRLYRAAQLREMERAAIYDHGISGATLMERAASAAWDCFGRTWPDCACVMVVCGAGNNGGDGYHFALQALRHGRKVKLVALAPVDSLRGDALSAAKSVIQQGAVPQAWSASALQDAEVIVDAIFGTGLNREVTDHWRAAIDAINASGKPVLALDIPSGLHADSGAVLGEAIRATMTITFLGLKTGLYGGNASDFTGAICFSDLALPPEAISSAAAAAVRIDFAQLRGMLPRRRRSAHKGDFGHVLVVGGDVGFAGAVRLAAEAAARIGSGLVSVATRPEHAAAIPAARPELMVRGVASAAELAPLLQRATVVAVGPGLGQSDWGFGLFARVIDAGLPMVVDADALNLLARDPCKRDDWIITPHPGEAARLLKLSNAEVQADRLQAARALQSQYGGVAVLKGSGTVIADTQAQLALCSDGNPGMAGGGMGDVLTGVIAGLLAQGLEPSAAAKLGVCVHAAAADACAVDGERGMLASDLIAQLRRLANP